MPPPASKIDIPVLAATPPARASHVDLARWLLILSFIAFEVSGAGAFALSKNPDAHFWHQTEAGAPQAEPALAEDGKPYTTLGYHNGPNVREADSPALSANMVQDKDFQQQTAVHMNSETHAGEDIYITTRVVMGQGKKLKLWHQMHRASDDDLLATCDQFLLHVSLATRRSCPPLPHVLEAVEALAAQHAEAET